MDDTRLHWIGLAALIDDVGARALHRILATAGNAERAWNADRDLLRRAECPERVAERFLAVRPTVNASAIAERCDREVIAVIPHGDPRYPKILAALPDPPVALFVRGNAATLSERAIAVVGTRTATTYGIAATDALVRPLARAGLTITSGLAYGIDAAAHRACLEVGGRTVAILGTGVDTASIYPAAHRALADEIVANGGCIASEYVPGTAGRPMHFPARNRIVAGLTQATLVIEAPADSGALITAQFALDFGREVFAVPGPITSPSSAGTNALLRTGATPATSANDITDALHLDALLPPAARTAPPRDGPAAAILAALTGDATHVDVLRERLAMPAAALAAHLTALEIDGAIRDVGGGRYIRVS